ncbi:MAG: thymidine phosphorylase [Deltaproteobacteria bacterium]|nr:thymidine phosphorylase [Deltaproteobacteria bacterium]
MSTPLPQELIRAKRDGRELSRSELEWFVKSVTDESIPDYQVAAMLMAIFFRGMTDSELAVWADAMLHSGDVLDLSGIARPKVDKHSTGGVGDKISIPLAPAVAACGIAVPMVSGRGLGHTGGTLDKLESIPGFRVDLDTETFISQTGDIGVCLIGQTDRIAPADRRLYALRDVTGTVESIPLIASSIMSKKLAEGIDGLVLDCKVGQGAFMKTMDDARALANAIRVIGQAAGKKVSVLITAMDAPIGQMVGNGLEIRESIEVLHGQGPADTRELTVSLGAEMLAVGGLCSAEEGQSRMEKALDDGSAAELFRKVVAAQGGDPAVVDDPIGVLPKAGAREPLLAERDGFVSAIQADEVGIAAMILGAGRRRKEDDVDPAVGIELAVGVGDRVNSGQPLAYFHHNQSGLEAARTRLSGAFKLTPEPPQTSSRVLEVVR